MTTNISDLPVDNNTPNVSFDVADKQQNQKLDPNINPTYNPTPPTPPVSDVRPPEQMSQNSMNELMSGLESAQQSGMTQLPSRDIPMNENILQHDEQIKAGYIAPPVEDYIGEYDNTQEIIEQNQRIQKEQDNLDYLYQEFQVPLLIIILYFIFLLPVTQDIMYKFLPKLFSKDGNLNTFGILCKSLMFGSVYYMLTKFMKHVSTI